MCGVIALCLPLAELTNITTNQRGIFPLPQTFLPHDQHYYHHVVKIQRHGMIHRGHIHCDGKQINPNALAVPAHTRTEVWGNCAGSRAKMDASVILQCIICAAAAGLTEQTFNIHQPQCHSSVCVCVCDGRNRKSGKHTKAYTHTYTDFISVQRVLRRCCLSAAVCKALWSAADLNPALHLHQPPAGEKTHRRHREQWSVKPMQMQSDTSSVSHSELTQSKVDVQILKEIWKKAGKCPM